MNISSDFGFTSNQTFYREGRTRDEEHNLEQIKLVLDIFQNNTRVLREPEYTAILILYIVLVSAAGIARELKESLKIM